MTVAARHYGLALGAGALATMATLLSPLGAGVPPLVIPWIYLAWLDLRFVLLPAAFVWTLFIGSRARWPGPATALVGIAVLTAIPAHIHASAVLDYVGVGFAEPGARVDLVALAASVGSILVALYVALDLARERFAVATTRAGVPEDEVAKATARADELSQTALTTAAMAVAVLALLLRIGDQFTGRERLPLPEIFALAVVLGIGALLVNLRSFGKGA